MRLPRNPRRPIVMPKVVPEYKAQARARIVEAAHAVLHRKGFGSSTMEEIAKELGVSKGALYLYFPNKAALLMAIQEASRIEVSARLAAVIESDDLAGDIASMLDELISEETDAAVYLSLMAEAAVDPAIRAALLDDRREDTKAIRGFLEKLKARGVRLRITDLDAAATLIIGVLSDAASRHMLGVDRAETRRELTRALRAIFGK